jgi:polyphenol oxidase
LSESASLLDMEWELPRGVRAAFTTRLGGVSAAPWDSFNVATHVGDVAEHVATNRAKLRELLSLRAEPAWLNQVHGVAVHEVDVSSPGAPTADAAVTSRAGVACAVMVADCLPVLFSARDGSRVGAAHAGWRGLASGVLEHTVKALQLPGRDLMAWMGPCISRDHFEVGEEVREEFVNQDASDSAYFERNTRGRWQADLVALARRRLQRLGVIDVSGGDWCTFKDPERFYSHRRDGKGGRLVALVWRDVE